MTHISTIEQLASQLNDLKEPISESQLLKKFLSLFRLASDTFCQFGTMYRQTKIKFCLLSVFLKKRILASFVWISNLVQPIIQVSQVNLKGRYSEDNANEAEEVLEPEEVDICPSPIENANFCGGTSRFIATSRERIKAEKEEAKKREISNIATDIQQPRSETNNNQDLADFSYQSFLPSTAQIHDKDKLWFAYSGATQSMTHLKSVLKNFIPVEHESWFFTGIGNTRLRVRGKGDIEAKSTINGTKTVIPIPNVLYIPKS
jgi:hypothetical protein